jgi:hypothetical protein
MIIERAQRSVSICAYVSGLYCGGNPQPGVGIVRSLRQGFPDARR